MIPSSAWLAVLSWMRQKCHWDVSSFILVEYVKSALSGYLDYAFKCILCEKMRRWLGCYLLVMGYMPFLISSIQRKNKLMSRMHLVTMQFSMAIVTTMFRLGNNFFQFPYQYTPQAMKLRCIHPVKSIFYFKSIRTLLFWIWLIQLKVISYALKHNALVHKRIISNPSTSSEWIWSSVLNTLPHQRIGAESTANFHCEEHWTLKLIKWKMHFVSHSFDVCGVNIHWFYE